MLRQQLNCSEQAVLSFIESRTRPVSISELAAGCFPYLSTVKANSRVRNSLRRIRDRLGLVKRVEAGKYVSALQPTVDLGEYQRIIRSAVTRNGGSFLPEGDVDDIVQQVNEKLLHKLPHFDKDRSSMVTFAYTVARSTMLDILRSKRRQPVMVELDEESGGDEDALAVLLRQEQETAVRKIISELPADEREFALLCMSDGFNLGRYAKEKGIARETVYVRKHRLMQKIGATFRNQFPT
jgi:RNA polymerase sigma factor (sigma-70 family)